MVGKSLSHYKIEAELGRGGMGIVYRAEDTKLDRTVAIKVLPSAALSSENDRARFYREAKAAAQLHHPHIASVFEIDEAVPEGSKDDDLRPFIAMEFIEGETLHDRIQKGPLKLEEAVRIASEIASALEAAHEKSIVHRDIKSANVMLTSKGSAKVLDFGLAQTAQSTKLTRLGSTLGTVAYMSPEQARGEEVDLRTDLWSLGAVLYEMIAGRSPFPGDYEQAVVYEILNQDPEPLTAVRTGVPMQLEQIVNKCLAKDVSFRYQNARDVIVDFKRIEISKSGTSTVADHSVVQPIQLAQSEAQTSSRAKISLSIFAAILVLAGTYFVGKWSADSAGGSGQPIHLNLDFGDDSYIGSPSWTPAGDKLFYVIATGWNTLVESYDLVTGQRHSFPKTTGAHYVKVTPDGESFVYAVGTTLYYHQPATIEPNPLIDNLGFPTVSWSGDSKFLYVSGRSVIEFDIEHGTTDTLVTNPRPVTADGETLGGVMFFPLSTTDPSRIYFCIFSSVSGHQLIYLNRKSGEVTVAGRGAPLAVSRDGFLVAVHSQNSHKIIAYPVDDASEIQGPSISLFEGVGFALSESGTAYLNTGFSAPGEGFFSITSDGIRESLGSIPGLPSLGPFTASPDRNQIIASGTYLDAVGSLVSFDPADGSSRRLNIDFGVRNPSYSSNGWVYFNDRTEPNSIYRIMPSRSGPEEPELVLSDSLMSVAPSASRSGLIVFVRQVMNTWRVFVYDPESGDVRQVTTQTGQQQVPTLHPDGNFVAYRQDFDGNRSIIVENIASGSRETVAPVGDTPIFALDGSALFYADGMRIHRRLINSIDNQIEFGEDEIVAFSPFNNHIHFAPGIGDVLVYTASPGSVYDSNDPYQIVQNYDVYLKQLVGRGN